MTIGKREKIFLSIGIVFVVVYAAIQFIILPLVQWQQRLTRINDAKATAVQEMQQLYARYNAIGSQSVKIKRQLSNRKQGFTLFSFLDQQAGQTGIKENITYMKPIQSTGESASLQLAAVEMKLVTISMDQLVNFLYRVETSPNVIWVKSLSIKQTGREDIYIDVVLMVETLMV